jgi:tRNA (adenine22-N1)-methyltransferase
LKLGKRLSHIEALVTEHYEHVWDCCCDHGLLGAALLIREAASVIHFVDIVPELIQQVHSKLVRFFPENSQLSFSSRWETHCINASELPIKDFNGKHLVIVAGIGGELMATIVANIYRRHSSTEIDFLLCPINEPYALRKNLIQLNFSLKNEILMVENKRFYEILLVSSAQKIDNFNLAISSVGSLIWQASSDEQAKNVAAYLTNTLAHFRRMLSNPNAGAQSIIDDYSSVVIENSKNH